MKETFTPLDDFIPTLTDMINGTRDLTDEQLEDLRKHIDLLIAERRSKRKEELRDILVKTFREYREEYPNDALYITVEAEEAGEIEVDLLDLIDYNI